MQAYVECTAQEVGHVTIHRLSISRLITSCVRNIALARAPHTGHVRRKLRITTVTEAYRAFESTGEFLYARVFFCLPQAFAILTKRGVQCKLFTT